MGGRVEGSHGNGRLQAGDYPGMSVEGRKVAQQLTV